VDTVHIQCTTYGVILTVKNIIIAEGYEYIKDLKKYNIPPNTGEALRSNTEYMTIIL